MSLSGKRIMVVDDEDGIRSLLKDELEMENAFVVEAETGKKALEVLSREKVDLIVSDIRMPVMDGVDMLKKIREHNPKLPLVIMMTGFSDYKNSYIEEIGALKVFSKPIDIPALMRLIQDSF